MIDLWTGSVLLYPASCNTQKKEKVYQAPPDLGWAFSLGYLTPTMAKKKTLLTNLQVRRWAFLPSACKAGH